MVNKEAIVHDRTISSQLPSNPIVGLLVIDVEKASGLPRMDLNGKADPYILVKLGPTNIWRSQTKKKTREPEFNETMKYLIRESESSFDIDLEVWDWDRMSSDDFAGTCRLEVRPLVDKIDGVPLKKELHIINHKKKDKVNGTLTVSAHFMSREAVEEEFWKCLVKHFDSTGDGRIDKAEFSSLLATLALDYSPEDVEKLYDDADTNKDGFLSQQEFVAFMKNNNERIVSKLLSGDPDLLCKVMEHTNETDDVLDVLMRRNFDVSPSKVQGGDHHETKVLMVYNRLEGRMEEEKIPHYIRVAMRLMYSTKQGRIAVNNNSVRKILKKLTISQGVKYDLEKSILHVPSFIKFHNLNEEELLDPLDSFKNFNEFFYRKLKKEARPIHQSDCVSPADCRFHAFRSITDATNIWIKGHNFTLKNVIQDEKLSERFVGGSMAICRLAPQDYHRFHIPVDGIMGSTQKFDGTYYTVNPIAITKYDVYTENKRFVTLIKSDLFGDVLFVTVGATMVGSIVLTSEEGKKVEKGDEHGYFAFGGSTVLLFFLPNAIQFDSDLLANSDKGLETLVKMGESIGRSVLVDGER
ncbi:phosphatidylserine decarboxylase [Acrasis kona]|uniref:Phosphatidylserine decarboxylase proenzyme 2 n=1 Tax=Acrasis kona TaxID=1008807 RepID=A0AAW2ZHR8_9EUKA